MAQKPFRAEQLNTALKGDTWEDIQEGLRKLLEAGVIAVSNKRFWIRDRPRAQRILNEEECI